MFARFVIIVMCDLYAALARLGVTCRLLSKIGSDANASFLLDSLLSQGVLAEDIFTGKANESTAFTYILVCQESHSRTCIHTPLQSEISPAEVIRYIEQRTTPVYEKLEYVHFDSRHTEAAVTLAQHIHNSCTYNNTILSIDVEKSRHHLPHLIRYCHIIFTNKTGIKEMFPIFSGVT